METEGTRSMWLSRAFVPLLSQHRPLGKSRLDQQLEARLNMRHRRFVLIIEATNDDGNDQFRS